MIWAATPLRYRQRRRRSSPARRPTKLKRLPFLSGPSEHRGPVDITGEKSIYDSRNDSFTVIGNAVMTQGGTVLKADQIDMMRRDPPRTRSATCISSIRKSRCGRPRPLDITKETLELENAKMFAKRNTYHLEGKHIRKLAGQNYKVLKGFFTTCGCETGTPDWASARIRWT